MDNNGWNGCLAKLDHDYREDFSFGFSLKDDYEKDAGAAPWLCGVKKGAWRWGPSHMPMPGLGCVVRCLTADLVVIVYRIDKLLRSGIAVSDAHSFLETTAGKKFADEHCAVLKASPQRFVWVPFGWACSLHNAVPSTSAKTKVPEVQFAMMFTIFNQHLAKKLATNLWAAIDHWNEQNMEKNRGRRLYEARSDLWQRFKVAVAEA